MRIENKIMAATAPLVVDDDEMNHTWSSMNGSLSFGNSDMDETHTMPSPNRNAVNHMNLMKGIRTVVDMDPHKEDSSTNNDSDKSTEDIVKTTINKSSTSNNSQKSLKKKNQENDVLLPITSNTVVVGGIDASTAKSTLMSTIAEEPIFIMDSSNFNKQISPRSANVSLTNKSIVSSSQSRNSSIGSKGDKKNKKKFHLFRRKKSNSNATAPTSSSSYNSSTYNPDYINETEEMKTTQKPKNNIVRSILLHRCHGNPVSHKKNNDKNGKDPIKISVSPDTIRSLSSQNLLLLSEHGDSRNFANILEERAPPKVKNINPKTDESKFDFPNFSLTHGEDGFPLIANPSNAMVSKIVAHPKNNTMKFNPNNTSTRQHRISSHNRSTNQNKKKQLMDPGIAKREMAMNEWGGKESNRNKSSNHKSLNQSHENGIRNRRSVRFSDTVTVPEDHQSVAVSFVHADDSCVSSMTGTVDKINRQLQRRQLQRRQQLLNSDKPMSKQMQINEKDEKGNDRFLGKTIHIRHNNDNTLITSSSYEETTEGDDFISSYVIPTIPSLPTSYTSDENSQFLERVIEDEDGDMDDPHIQFIRQKAQATQGVMDHPNYDESSSVTSSKISSSIVTEDWSCTSHSSHEEDEYGKSIYEIRRQILAQHQRITNDVLSNSSSNNDSLNENDYIDDRIRSHHTRNMYP